MKNESLNTPNTSTLDNGKEEVAKLNSYLEVCTSIASLLVHSENAHEQVEKVLAMMGKATQACRCYWAELQADADEGVVLRQKAEYCARGIASRLDHIQMSSLYQRSDTRWYRELSAGRTISGLISEFPENERKVLQSQGVWSILVLPAFIRDKFVGFVGLDNCSKEKSWEAPEANLLRFTADSIAKAFDHEYSFKASEKSEARYREISENISDFWCLHDMDGRFMEVNPAIERTLGYSQTELLSMRVPDLIPESHKDQFEAYLNELKEKGNAGGLVRMVTKSGEERILGYRNWLVHLPAGNVAARCLFRDVTERVTLESQLRHSQKMESIGTLAGGIAHNFRNILSGIMNYAELIGLKSIDDPTAKKYAGEIIRLTEIGSDLIKNLLRFSHKTNDVPKKRFNLIETLGETYNIISKSFEKWIDIQTEWPEMIPVYGESSALIQVFLNLCTNARDAMPDGGILRITARKAKDKAVVEITDTGAGMDESTLKKIYDPFYTTKAPDKGTGLGLSTAYGIIQDYSGEIRAKSRIGLGTSFEITLPISDSKIRDTQQPKDRTKIHGNREKLLLVDDDTFVLEPLEEMLTGYGYQTRSASTGKQAIEEYRSWHPHVVLLDRNLPEMGGLKILETIFSIDPEARVILISGYEAKGPEGIDEKISSSIKGYITKPFDLDEVIRMLTRILGTGY